MPCWLKFSVEELSSARSGFSRQPTASQRWEGLLLIVMVLILKLEFLVIRKKANFQGDTRNWQDISTSWWNGLDEPTRARVSLVFSLFFIIFCQRKCNQYIFSLNMSPCSLFPFHIGYQPIFILPFISTTRCVCPSQLYVFGKLDFCQAKRSSFSKCVVSMGIAHKGGGCLKACQDGALLSHVCPGV